MIVVRLNPADFRCCANCYSRLFVRKEILDHAVIDEIQFRRIARQQISETFRFESPNERAADHSAMAGNKDFVRFLQLHCSFSSQKLPGKQYTHPVFGLVENNASILNQEE